MIVSSSLSELLGGVPNRPATPLPEAVVVRLQETLEHYQKFCLGQGQPREGDILTPRAECPVTGHGRPYIVLEVRSVPAEPHAANMLKMDVRLAFLHEQDEATIATIWAESWWFEPWVKTDARLEGAMGGSA